MKYSILIPIYNNQSFIPELIDVLTQANQKLENNVEAVFVIDGSPDQSYALLRDALPKLPFPAQLIAHSRNFGSFAAIRTGLKAARGQFFAVMAADLQEPPALLLDLFAALDKNECDVAIGTRSSRQDPFLSRMTANFYWKLYRKLVVHDMPPGGVDIFACNELFRSHLLQLEESRSSLIALIFWLGFRRKLISYERQPRKEGKSAWTFRKKVDYMMDSIFSFTDYPVRLLTKVGAITSFVAVLLSIFIIIARLTQLIIIPGYAAIIVSVLLLGALNLFGLGLIGIYSWRGYENSKQRPLAVVAIQHSNHENLNDF